jgi:hypothetical protein
LGQWLQTAHRRPSVNAHASQSRFNRSFDKHHYKLAGLQGNEDFEFQAQPTNRLALFSPLPEALKCPIQGPRPIAQCCQARHCAPHVQ